VNAGRRRRPLRQQTQDPAGAAEVQRWLLLAASKIACGTCAARLVKLFDAPRDLAAAQRIASDLFAVLDAERADRRFATGAAATIADVAAYAYIAHAPEGGVSLAPYPHLRAWLARGEAMPGFVPMPRGEEFDVAQDN
jgi:glutathione S-transferase